MAKNGQKQVYNGYLCVTFISKQSLLPRYQSTYLRGPESASIKIPPFRLYFIKFSKSVSYEVNLTPQCSHLEVHLLNTFGLKGDSVPLLYLL